MWAQIISMIVGMVGGAVVNGVTTWNTAMKNAEEYTKAAEDIRAAGNRYSGKQGYNKMIEKGIDEASELGMAAGNATVGEQYQPTGPGATGSGANTNAYTAAQNTGDVTNNAAMSGFEQGMDMQNARNQALYNANTTLAQQKLNQADIDYKAKTQAVQEGMKTIGNAAQLYNNIRGRRSSNGTRTVTE